MFRRRKTPEGADASEGVEIADDAATDEATPGRRARGPWDVSEVEVEDAEVPRIDLGSLLITPHENLDIQLHVDETGEVAAVVVEGEEGAAELRAFAAPRHGDIWEDSRAAVAAEVAQLGGTATERDGAWGTELVVSLTVDLPDGGRAQQESVLVGISGPRWLLRATLVGRPAVRYDEHGDVESALREVVVVRGSGPVPPGDALPLTVPPNTAPDTAMNGPHGG